MKEVVLPSGALLGIGDIPFEAANNLKKEVMRQIKEIDVSAGLQVLELGKDYLCSFFGSETIENFLWPCMMRCTYNGLKIDKTTFEPIAFRSDYTQVQYEVGMEALLPFLNGLYAVLKLTLDHLTKSIPS